jgi:predicted nuclease with TOPRIM domain
MSEVTLDDVIRERQRELIDQSNALRARLEEIKQEADEINRKMAKIYLESQMLDAQQDRGVVITHTETFTATISDRRKSPTDKLLFEDAVRKIFDRAGRPLPVRDIIAGLEPYGWQWSQYSNARNFIANSELLEPAGKRGYYQLHRPRW